VELLHRYLGAVELRLPRRGRDDIVAELREELLSQIEERQAQLRRMLTADEIIRLLKAYGHPFVVAARYDKRQILMGPEMYPFYWLALQMLLGVVVLVHVFGAVIGMVSGRPPSETLDWMTGSLWIVSMYMTGVVTFSFFAMDRLGVGRWIGSAWSPRFLPPVRLVHSVSRLKAMFDWTFMLILMAWATLALFWPMPASSWSVDGRVSTLPVWSSFGVELATAFAAQLTVYTISWVAPSGQMIRLSVQVLVKLGVLVAVAMFFRNKPWFAASDAAAESVAKTLQDLHLAASTGLMLLTVLALFGLLFDVRNLIRTVTRVPVQSGLQ
jgi:hypothetical protein